MSAPVQVAKVGGTQLESREGLEALAHHVTRVRESGRRPIVVHGEGRELTELELRSGLRSEMEVPKILGLGVTTERGMELATMVLCGLVNKRVVAFLTARGCCAVGLSGVDFGFMRSALLNRTRLGRVGGPPRVDVTHIRPLLDAGCVPVVAPVCLGADRGLVNVDADTVAQSLAVALDADVLEFVSSVDAVRDEDGPVRHVAAHDVDDLVSRPAVQGALVPELHAGLAAVEGGVRRVRIGSFDSLACGEATVMQR